MKKSIIAAVLILGAFFCAFGQNSDTIDLVLLLDTSSSMGSSFEKVNDYITGKFLSEFLRVGDTFHLISFSSSPRLDIARKISAKGDIETIIGRMLIQYPVETGNNVTAAVNYAEAYIATLPPRPKKIVVVSAAGPETSGIINSAKQRFSSKNTTFDFVSVTDVIPGSPNLSNPPGSGRSSPRQSSSQQSAQSGTESNTGTGSAKPAGTASTQGTSGTQGTSTQGASQTGTQSGSQGGTTQGASQTGTSQTGAQSGTQSVTAQGASQTSTQSGTQGGTTQGTTGTSQTGAQTSTQGAGTQSTTNTQTATQTTSDTSVTGSSAQGTSSSDNKQALDNKQDTQKQDSAAKGSSGNKSAGTSGQKKSSSINPTLLLIIGIIAAVLLLILLIYFISRRLGSSPNRVMASVSSSGGKDEKFADHSKYLANYAAGQSKKRVTPYQDRPVKQQTGAQAAINPSGPLLLNLFVDDQSTSIGKRNIHSLKSGYSLSVGGGKSDDFHIFLVSMPSHLGDIRRNGSQLTFIPRKPKYFPDIGSNEVKECINKKIRVVSDKGYEMWFSFVTYEDPLEALNRVLHSIKVPG
jgi:hypothetical protein